MYLGIYIVYVQLYGLQVKVSGDRCSNKSKLYANIINYIISGLSSVKIRPADIVFTMFFFFLNIFISFYIFSLEFYYNKHKMYTP